MQINEYLRSELVRAGFAGVDVQKTPLGVRITLRTSRPGLVIGKGGKRIQEITDVLPMNVLTWKCHRLKLKRYLTRILTHK
ncbi:MAG: KH domain-containing protein [Promethearchaeota archaeon]|jgi:ribosomal protein S3